MKSERKQGCYENHFYLQCTWFRGSSIKHEKEIRTIRIGQEEIKLLSFTENMVVYFENSKESIDELLELISEFIRDHGGKKGLFKNQFYFHMGATNQ